MKTIIVRKKEDENKPVVRRCLNCGQDITNRRKDAKFCSAECRQTYRGTSQSWDARRWG